MMKFPFSFGEGSYAAHIGQLAGRAAIVRRRGLAFDIDTARDLDMAIAAGMPFEFK